MYMLYMFEIRIKYKYFIFFISLRFICLLLKIIIANNYYYSPNFLCQKFTSLFIFSEYT